ncbi:hypothetical protein OROMI_020123 [Orobanche minor]
MAKKRQRTMLQGAEKKVKIDKKMRKLFQKRARDYESDGDEEDEPLQEARRAVGVKDVFKKTEDEFEEDGFSDDGEEENERFDAEEVSEDENGRIQPGHVQFAEGIKAFKLAFKKIVKKSKVDEDVLGPVLSADKKLIAEKLAEEEAEKKVKGEAKKEKHLIAEKGHVKLENTLDAHEKFLLGIATKGVVNKAQNARKGLNPSRSRDEKVIKKRRKEAFFSELGRTASQSAGTVVKVGTSGGSVGGEGPAWAPLRDNYMLTNPKLKDWDKMQDTNTTDDFGRRSESDSDDD